MSNSRCCAGNGLQLIRVEDGSCVEGIAAAGFVGGAGERTSEGESGGGGEGDVGEGVGFNAVESCAEGGTGFADAEGVWRGVGGEGAGELDRGARVTGEAVVDFGEAAVAPGAELAVLARLGDKAALGAYGDVECAAVVGVIVLAEVALGIANWQAVGGGVAAEFPYGVPFIVNNGFAFAEEAVGVAGEGEGDGNGGRGVLEFG